MQQDVVLAVKDKVLTAHIKCEIDHHAARRIREKIDRCLTDERPEILVMDFSEVKFMDSSGLGLILGRVDKADSVKASVRLEGLSAALMKLIRLSGLEKVKNLSVKK